MTKIIQKIVIGIISIILIFGIIYKIFTLKIKPDISPQRMITMSQIKEQTIWTHSATQMEFVSIQDGCFNMGSPDNEKERHSDEGPVHVVCLSSFMIGKYEVTKRQFQIFVEQTGYKTDAEQDGFSWIYTGKWEQKSNFNWKITGFEQTDNDPVVHISYRDANAMAQWMSSLGQKFRLPTEEEWEYVCRAGTQTSRYWGDAPDKACKYANIGDFTAQKTFVSWEVHQCDDNFVYTSPVGNYQPNAFGVFDMIGNVWEWCNDRYYKDSYSVTYYNKIVYNKGTPVVIRGGSWYSRPAFTRSASRDNLMSAERRSNDLGFRLVKEN